MRAQWISIPVDDQARALKFYTDRLGFMPKVDVPVGDDARWLTVVSPEDPDGVEVVLEPKGHPAADDFTAHFLRGPLCKDLNFGHSPSLIPITPLSLQVPYRLTRTKRKCKFIKERALERQADSNIVETKTPRLCRCKR